MSKSRRFLIICSLSALVSFLLFYGPLPSFLLGLGAVVYGVYMSLRYLLVPYVLVDDEQISIGRAFKKTAHLTDGVKWKLAQLLIISIIINIIGSIPASIGLLISLPISYLALLIAYRTLLKA